MNNKLSTTTRVAQTLAAIALMSFAATSVSAQALPDYGVESVPNKDKEYSPYLDRGYPQKILWGDSHLHTGWSTDAGFMGATNGPEEAYRFARGEEVISSHGIRTKLVKPLDWLVVADHAENLGLAPMAREAAGLRNSGIYSLPKAHWGI